MLSLLLGLLSLVLRAANLAMLVYCVMSFVMPQSELYHRFAMYVEPLLQPVRMKLYRWFPALRNLPLDFSPLAIWLAIDVLQGILNLLRRVF